MAMSDRLSIRSDIDALELPQAPDGVDPLGYDLVSLFVFPKRIAATYAAYRKHHVPEYIINNTMREYENSIDEYKQRFGKIGFSIGSLNWGQDIVDTLLFRIMRLNFELLPEFGGQIKVFSAQTGEQKTLVDGIRLHRSGLALGSPALEDDDGSYDANLIETPEYWEGYPVIDGGRAAAERIRIDKKSWKLILQSDDPIIDVHIPRDMRLTPEICEQSYADALKLIKTCYPEFKAKAFACYSWLLDPQLEMFFKTRFKYPSFSTEIYSISSIKQWAQRIQIRLF